MSYVHTHNGEIVIYEDACPVCDNEDNPEVIDGPYDNPNIVLGDN